MLAGPSDAGGRLCLFGFGTTRVVLCSKTCGPAFSATSGYMRKLLFQSLLFAVALIGQPLSAQSVHARPSSCRFQLGILYTSHMGGLSGMYLAGGKTRIQAVLGVIETPEHYGVRYVRMFAPSSDENYAFYGFGGLSVVDAYRDNAFALSAGGGIEFDLAGYMSSRGDSFPTLFTAFELGFDRYSEDATWLNGLAIGAAGHYRF